MMSQAVIRSRGVKKSYGSDENKVDALKSTDLDIYANTLTLLVGPSGSGKTTLISIIATILTPDEGELLLLENNMMDLTDNEKKRREKVFLEREKALKDVKVLRGLLPICASCKKIRDDQGYWSQIETYIKEHTEADFSHSICPGCAERLYPEFLKK